jgi:hypothetical protein
LFLEASDVAFGGLLGVFDSGLLFGFGRQSTFDFFGFGFGSGLGGFNVSFGVFGIVDGRREVGDLGLELLLLGIDLGLLSLPFVDLVLERV